jgi:hypothetical protein
MTALTIVAEILYSHGRFLSSFFHVRLTMSRICDGKKSVSAMKPRKSKSIHNRDSGD